MTTPLVTVSPGDDLSSWSVSRALSGSGLPGQARVTTGNGTASGSADVRDAEQSTAWNPGSGEIAPGEPCTLDVSLSGGIDSYPLLRGVIRQVSVPGVLSPLRSLSVEDDLSRLGRPLWLGSAFPIGAAGSVIDAASLIELAARAGGYRMVPISAGTVLSVPLCGSLAVEGGDTAVTTGSVVSWQTIAGRIAPNPLAATTFSYSSYPTAATKVYLSLIHHGGAPVTAEMRIYAADGVTYRSIYIRVGVTSTMTGTNVEASRDGSTWTILQEIADTFASRVEVELSWTSSTVVSVRSRGAGTTASGQPAWTIAYTLTAAAFTAATWRRTVLTGVATALMVATSPSIWSPEAARIAGSGSSLTSILLPKGITTIDTIQSVTGSTDAAWWVDESGVLRYLPRATLIAQSARETVESLTSLRDVPSSTSTDDLVDRVEATFSPPVVSTVTDYSLGIFEATDKIAVAAGQTVALEYDLDTSAESLAPWSRAETGSEPTLSRWSGRLSPTGAPTQVAASDMTLNSVLVGPRRVRITIKNNRASGTVWMVGVDGTPHLIVRANKRVDSGEQQTVSAGATADAARYPASLDLGAYVQSATTAQAIVDALMTSLATPLPVLTGLSIYPSVLRRLGDVINLTDPISGLSCRGVICKIDNSGSAGSWQQSIDLAVLAYT